MQAFGQRGDFAENQQRRCAHGFGASAFGQVGERAEHDALFGARAVFDQGERRRRRAAVREQTFAQNVQPGDTHVHRERLFFLRECAPVERIE